MTTIAALLPEHLVPETDEPLLPQSPKGFDLAEKQVLDCDEACPFCWGPETD